MAYSKQPVLSSLPIIIVENVFDPPIANQNYDISNGTLPHTIFDGSINLTDAVGGMIHRITVTACADTVNNPDVTAKLIFLCIKAASPSTGYSWNLYKTGVMFATTISDTVPNPEIVWEFEGGLPVYQSGDYTKIGILATANYSTNNYYGDYVSCVVEYTDNNIF